MLNLKDAFRILMGANGDPRAISNQEELQDLVKDIDLAGAEVLDPVSVDELYTAVTLMLSAASADLMRDGELNLAIMLLANKKASLGMMTVCLRFVMGIREVEGWK